MPCIYIYFISSPNPALSLAIFVQERERGRLNGARDGASRTPGRARESLAGAMAEYGGAGPVRMDLRHGSHAGAALTYKAAQLG